MNGKRVRIWRLPRILTGLLLAIGLLAVIVCTLALVAPWEPPMFSDAPTST